ncbi:TA system antitoxin ParD family protein [Phenylobacterium sp.]|uniref:TA system antitoxin ParD family protein n=1 Tax=Phenylobacterium sp. TaxID=1871053 RepID=UPI002FE2ECC2
MAARHASVKLSTDFLEEARREAEAFNRSLGAQVEHWARIGRRFENAPGVGIDRVRAALEGRLRLEDLSEAEQDAVMGRMGDPWDAQTEAHYAELGRKDGAVGRDGQGRLVRREGGRLRPVG